MTDVANDMLVLRAIEKLAERQGYPPTVREIATDVGINLSTTHWHLSALRGRMLITWQPRSQRTLMVTQLGARVLDDARMRVVEERVA